MGSNFDFFDKFLLRILSTTTHLGQNTLFYFFLHHILLDICVLSVYPIRDLKAFCFIITGEHGK